MKTKTIKKRLKKAIARRTVRLAMIRDPNSAAVVIGVTPGALGGPVKGMLRIDDLTMVGATEDPRELAGLVTQLGAVVLHALVGGEARDPRVIAVALCSFAGVDVEKVLAELRAEGEPESSFEGIERTVAEEKLAGGVLEREHLDLPFDTSESAA